MINHYTKLSSLSSVLVLLAISVHAQQKTPASEFVGKFVSPYSTITIDSTGRYREQWGGDSTESYESGKYTYEGGTISFLAAKAGTRFHGEKHWQNLFDPKIYRKFNGDDPPRALQREFSLVKWGDRLYLMERESFVAFVNVINFGIEPRDNNGCVWPVVGAFYLRDGDEKKTAVGDPSLPDNLVGMILRKPTETMIVGIEGDGHEKVAVLDRGIEAGLRPGMRLLLDRGQPKLWGGMQILSVTDHSARMSLDEKATIGDKVISRFEQVRLTVTIR